MDSRNILSRRSLLKASTFLVAATAAAPVMATAAPAVPQVLTTLLAEYADAAREACASRDRFRAAEQEKSDAIDAAALYFRWPDGSYGRIGDRGNTHHPEYALKWLKQEQAKELAAHVGTERGDQLRRAYTSTARQLRRLQKRYDTIVAQTDWGAACNADSASGRRFSEAKTSLCAYRPETVTEVAAVIRCVSAVGMCVGFCSGLTMHELAAMLDGGVAQ